jgi:hypothetical protein
MGAVRVRWSTLARWVGAGLAMLLALQALPPLLRPPPPGPLAADIGLPRVRAAKPVARPIGDARVFPARALPARRRADRRRRRPTGRKRPIEAGARLAGENPADIAPEAEAEAAAPPAPPPVTAAPSPAPPPPPADGSVEFMPH